MFLNVLSHICHHTFIETHFVLHAFRYQESIKYINTIAVLQAFTLTYTFLQCLFHQKHIMALKLYVNS